MYKIIKIYNCFVSFFPSNLKFCMTIYLGYRRYRKLQNFNKRIKFQKLINDYKFVAINK